VRIRIRDPNPGSDTLPFKPLDSGWVKSQDPDSGSGMSNPDHIPESLETIFWVKTLKFFDADLGFGIEKIRIRDGKKSNPG
jgi:hypothetical protein